MSTILEEAFERAIDNLLGPAPASQLARCGWYEFAYQEWAAWVAKTASGALAAPAAIDRAQREDFLSFCKLCRKRGEPPRVVNVFRGPLAIWSLLGTENKEA